MDLVLAQEAEKKKGRKDLHSVAAIKVSFSSDNQLCIIKIAQTAELIFRRRFLPVATLTSKVSTVNEFNRESNYNFNEYLQPCM